VHVHVDRTGQNKVVATVKPGGGGADSTGMHNQPVLDGDIDASPPWKADMFQDEV